MRTSYGCDAIQALDAIRAERDALLKAREDAQPYIAELERTVVERRWERDNAQAKVMALLGALHQLAITKHWNMASFKDYEWHECSLCGGSGAGFETHTDSCLFSPEYSAADARHKLRDKIKRLEDIERAVNLLLNSSIEDNWSSHVQMCYRMAQETLRALMLEDQAAPTVEDVQHD